MMDEPTGDVEVLLVDDDVEWVRTAGAALEDADEALSVITATGGWEALDLLAAEDFDCVVCDYRMPDFDGIALLERIRADHGDVPFILVTGSGSEAVASRAISSRVTDYFTKDPARNQSRALAMRIRTAVEAHRNRAALDAERRRFAQLFEGVPDPTTIVDGSGTVVDANEAFEERFGARDSVDAEPIASIVAAFEPESDDGIGDREARLLEVSTQAGERDFLVRRVPLGRPGRDEVGYVLTDVTVQRDRQRELERFHELSVDVRELLLSAESRAELQERFCATVLEGIGDAWTMLLGGPMDELTIRATAGGVQSEVETALVDASGTEKRHPVRAAMRTGGSQYVPDVQSSDADWAHEAGSAGVHSILVVPVERDELPLGAFVVCALEAGSLDETTRDRLGGLVSSLGDALGLLDRVAALTAEQVVRVQLAIADDDLLLNRLGQQVVSGGAQVSSAVPRGEDRMALYVDLPPATLESVTSWVDDADGLVAEVVSEGERQSRVRIETDSPGVPGVLHRQAVDVHSIELADGEVTVAFDVPATENVRGVVEAIEADYASVVVHSIRSVDRAGDEPGEALPLGDLTEKQRRALVTAYHEGYFEQPRARSADDVAAALDISRSTFLQHLHTAERKLLTNLLAWRESSGPD